MRGFIEKHQRLFWGIISLSVLLLIWYIGSQMPDMGKLLPNPFNVMSFVFQSFVKPIGSLVMSQHILWSLSRVLVGYSLAVIVGITLGFRVFCSLGG